MVTNTSTQSKLGHRIGLTQGDKLLEFNGKPFSLQTYQSLFAEYQETAKAGSTVSWKVLRKNEAGIWEEKLLSTTILAEPSVGITLKPDPNAAAKQKALLENWLK